MPRFWSDVHSSHPRGRSDVREMVDPQYLAHVRQSARYRDVSPPAWGTPEWPRVQRQGQRYDHRDVSPMGAAPQRPYGGGRAPRRRETWGQGWNSWQYFR